MGRVVKKARVKGVVVARIKMVGGSKNHRGSPRPRKILHPSRPNRKVVKAKTKKDKMIIQAEGGGVVAPVGANEAAGLRPGAPGPAVLPPRCRPG